MRVLVTGGAGYVGAFTVRRLWSAGHDVRVVDNLNSGSRQAIPAVPLDVVDLRDQDALRTSFAGFQPDAVMHLAGLKSAPDSLERPREYFEVNVRGTRTVLELCREHNVAYVLFASSSAVYGTPRETQVNESSRLRPCNPYGESKLACERMIEWHGQAYGLKHAILRYFNIAGAASDASLGEDPHHRPGQVVPALVRAGLRFGPVLPIYGHDYPTPDGTALRDYVHVEDVADIHLRILDTLRHGGESGTYNVGRGVGTSVLDLVHALQNITGQAVPLSRRDRRSGDVAAVWADTHLVVRTFGWRASYGLRDIVRSELAWQGSWAGQGGNRAAARSTAPAPGHTIDDQPLSEQ